MELKKLFEMQKELDSHIIKKHEREDIDLINYKIVAFIVEFGELANEVRFFKYWSNKGPSSREVILEEYVDGLHLILSIGNDLDVNINGEIYPKTQGTYVKAFTHIVDEIMILTDFDKEEVYWELLNEYLGFGMSLGFTLEEIEIGYKEKNRINHNRQESGY